MKIIIFILIAFFILLTSFPAQIKAVRPVKPRLPVPAECKHIEACVNTLIKMSSKGRENTVVMRSNVKNRVNVCVHSLRPRIAI